MGDLRSHSRDRRGEKGFTLIELLVVVTIIGILAAIVSVGVGGFTGKASVQAHKNTINGVQAAVDAYIADHYDGSGAAVAPTTAETAGGAGLTTLSSTESGWYGTDGTVATTGFANNLVYQTVAFDLLTKSSTTVLANTTRTQGPYLRPGANASIACVFQVTANTSTGTATTKRSFEVLMCSDTAPTAGN